MLAPRQFSMRETKAFTLIALAFVILILVLLVLLFILELKRWKREAAGETCRQNLKLVGLAYRTWNTGSSDEYPQQVEVKLGGSKEDLIAGRLFLHFRTMSNELSTPKILVCPADKQKLVAQSFGEGFSNTNVSYFASLNASESYPQTFLSGDRNLSLPDRPVASGILVLTTNSPLRWTKAIHDSCGNVGLGDGSVQMFDQKKLAVGVLNQAMETNRLVLP